ncbi:ABC transporter ATP-binding protein/permease [Crocinitomicaceae bacterium]|nr:ABC transporter ATP-binding protein/permease [Crocinitomicaceae bacterium]MDC1384599.1 ABC transporter ATP-binding protein/permease [Crocinitomicaceae bacterium]|tara:strand:+ start:2545 stop:4299 length:1755 start_codon:yes stop_codon:yes gene_type:complete
MKSLSYLNKYFIKYKWRMLLGILFIIGTNLAKVLMPQYFGDVTDELKEWNSTYNPDDLFYYAFKVGGYYIALSLIAGIFLFLTRQTIIIMSRYIEYDLKNEIYQQYQKLSYTFFKKNNTGDLMTRISEDVTKVRMYLGPGIMYTINLAVLSILVISVMISINGWLTLVVLAPLPLMSFIIYKVASRINKISTTVQKEQSFMSTLVQETFSGIRVIKAYDRTKEIEDKFNLSANGYKNKNMKLVFVNALFMPTIFILVGLSSVLCIYLGGIFHINGDMTIGDITKFIFFVNMLTWPFASVGWVTSLIQRAAASQERINEFLKEEPEIVNRSQEPLVFKKEIEFRNVSYTFPNSGVQAINNLSFIIEKGESLGIIGRTGCGKSTIIQLLTRQVEPQSGVILIDGKNINDCNLDELRSRTSVVPQDVFLFSDTIKNNISFGLNKGDTSEEMLIEVTKQAHVYHNIVEFKSGFDTLLGERGVNLSGGQKQRISIARALIRTPEILILDDCLSAVDTETEKIILRNFKNMNDVTSMIVSHRVSSIRNASRIINIAEGRLTEKGTHEELIQANGTYAELYQKQLAEEETS